MRLLRRKKHHGANFSFKVVCKKAIISENYGIDLLMLDMSKAFDIIERGTRIDDLKSNLESDELFLIYLLLKDVKLMVKMNNEFKKKNYHKYRITTMRQC